MNLFDFDYNLHPQNLTGDKEELQNTILNMYRYREIGIETPWYFKQQFTALFFLNLKKLNELLDVFYGNNFIGSKTTKDGKNNHDRTITDTGSESVDETIDFSLTSHNTDTTKTGNIGDRYLDTPESVLGTSSTQYATNINNRNISENMGISETGVSTQSNDKTKSTNNKRLDNYTDNESYTITQIYDYSKALNDRQELKEIYYWYATLFEDLFMGVF